MTENALQLIDEIQALAKRGADNELRQAAVLLEVTRITEGCPRCKGSVHAAVLAVLDAVERKRG